MVGGLREGQGEVSAAQESRWNRRLLTESGRFSPWPMQPFAPQIWAWDWIARWWSTFCGTKTELPNSRDVYGPLSLR